MKLEKTNRKWSYFKKFVVLEQGEKSYDLTWPFWITVVGFAVYLIII